MLKIKNLTKIYAGEKRAVDNLSLHIKPGELFGFIGHNGAGKTTTLRAIAGILSFDSGAISIGDYDLVKNPVKAKRISAFLPDNPDMYEFLSGIKYLKFISDIYDIPKNKRMPLIKKYSDAFELTGVLGSPIGSYSHGMKQKLALISAFIRQPRLLILDEPFVGLDPKAAFVMKGFLNELCESGGSVFFSTHVLDVAEKLCTKIAIIKNGKLVAQGDTKEITGDSSLESVFLDLEENEPEEAEPEVGS